MRQSGTPRAERSADGGAAASLNDATTSHPRLVFILTGEHAVAQDRAVLRRSSTLASERGIGFWRGDTDEDNAGAGLILGAGVTLMNRGKHNLQFGIQYAPAFTDPGTVHNLGFTLGYQFL